MGAPTVGIEQKVAKSAKADMAAEEHDDSSLVRCYLEQGDRDALGLLLERHSGLAFRTAMRVLNNNAAEAQDAVQMAFVEIMRALPQCRDLDRVVPWMMSVVVNTCRDAVLKASRRRKREENFVAEAEVKPLGDRPMSDMAEQIKQALAKIPERYRLPVWLHHYEGLPFDEVAVALSVPENTVRSQASRGVAALRDALTQAGMSVTMSGIVAAIPQLPPEAAPAALLGNIEKIVHGLGEFAGAPAGLAGKSGAFAGWKLALTAGAVLAAAGIGAGIWALTPGRPQPPPAAPAPAFVEKLYARWDFNEGEPPREIAVKTKSSWRFVPGGGPDGSGCMQTETDVFFSRLDIRPDSLPILIAYDEAIVVPQTWNTGYASCVSWERYKGVVLFNNICKSYSQPTPSPGREHGEWSTQRVYVTDRWIGAWEFGRLSSLMVFDRVPDSPIEWALRGRWRIDNMVIRTVRPEDVPDVSAYLAAVEKIPPSERKGTVAVPGLKGVADPDKPVIITFCPASERPADAVPGGLTP